MNYQHVYMLAVILSLLRSTPVIAQESRVPSDGELKYRSLMIITPSVVDDTRAEYPGKWSFGYLMAEMANEPKTGIKPEDLALAWVDALEPNAMKMRELILMQWPQTNGVRMLRDAPFRLVGIVNRIDLRNNFVLGAPSASGSSAGEVRFIYCIADGKEFEPRATIIFEFNVKRRTFEDVKQWAHKWYELSAFAPDSSEFKISLEALTDTVVGRDGDLDATPNCNNFAALRVSQSVESRAWNFLEFRLDIQNTGMLRKVTTKQTPIKCGINGEPVFDDFLRYARDSILRKTHVIPLRFNNMPFLADVADAEEGVGLYWNGTKKLDPSLLEARHLVSLNTCSGCHARETGEQKEDFFHVFPRARGAEARLSGFMTGIKNVKDPAGQMESSKVKEREFHELQDRVTDLRGLVERGREYESTRIRKLRVH